MLIIQIAIAIVLAVLILRFLPGIVGVAFALIVAAIAISAVYGLWLGLLVAWSNDAVIPWHAASDLRWPVACLALGGAFILLRRSVGSADWTPARVQASVGTALRLLLIYPAACALTGGGTYRFTATALILLGYPIAHSLRKVFPPT